MSFLRAKGEKGRTSKSKKRPKRGSVSHLLIDPCRFLWNGVSRDAEHNGEVQNAFTSCFSRQTGSASIFLLVIDWFMPFSQEGGFSGSRTLWWSGTCRHFLFHSLNRKSKHFPVYKWFIRAVFSWRGFLGMMNTMVKYVETARIKQLQAGKCWHFLFDEQNRKWWYLWLHHSVPHP